MVGRGVLSVELQHCISEARSFYCQQAHFRFTEHVNDKDGACCLHWQKTDRLAPLQKEGSAPDDAGDSSQDNQQVEMYDPAEPTSPIEDHSSTEKQPRRSADGCGCGISLNDGGHLDGSGIWTRWQPTAGGRSHNSTAATAAH